jgi:protein-S-isoprenylcysteine O-methyltransferase Ste14
MEGRRNIIVAAALSLWRAVWRTAVFAAFYIGFRWVLRYLPDFDVWIGGGILLDVSGFHLSVQQLPLVAVGWMFYAAGGLVMRSVSYRLRHIRVDHSHRSSRLLTDGIYVFSRHPMYSCFILTYIGIGVALHSLWGLIAGIFFSGISVLNTFYEERKLIEQFGDAYRRYREEVRRRLLPWYAWILLLLSAAGIVAGFMLRT